MKRGKKWLSILLIIVLCVGMLPGAVLADETDGVYIDETSADIAEVELEGAETPAVESAETLVEEAAEEPIEEITEAPAEESVEGNSEESPVEEPVEEGLAETVIVDSTAEVSAEETATEETDEGTTAVQTVQTLIDALPTADELAALDDEALNQVYARAQAANDAYETLTAEEQAQVDDSKLDELFELFNSMTDTMELTAEGGTLTSGEYTLTDNVTLTTNITIPSGAEVTIDLAGYTLTGAGGTVITVDGGSLTLKDSVGTGVITGGNVSTASGVGGVNITNGGTITMYGGSITGNTGKGVQVLEGCTFTMYGGSISNNAARGYGGGVRVYMGTFNMYGGSITGNTVTLSSTYGDGAGVYLTYATMNMYGGSITNNTVTATSTSGKAASGGGGVYLYNGSVLNMTGGSITGNSSCMGGGGVHVQYTSSQLSQLNVSGSVVISGNTTNGMINNVYLTNNANTGVTEYITLIGALAENASIGVTTAATVSDGTDVTFVQYGEYASSLACFTSDAGYYVAVDEAGAFVLTTDPTVYVATVTSGETVTKYATLQAAINAATEAGDTVKLLADITGEDITIASTQSITLDLNGCTLTGTGSGSVITVEGALTLTDSSTAQTGTITGGKATTTATGKYGGGVYVNSGAVFTMISGTISGNTATYGGGIYVTGGTFTMTGGSVSGNTGSNCGGVYIASGTAKISGNASITGNTASALGGGLYISGSSVVTLSGNATVSNNFAGKTTGQGGGVYIYSGTLILSGNASVTGNTAGTTTGGHGGGVFIKAGTLTMSDNASITGNSAGTYGGGIYLSAAATTLKLSGSVRVTGNTLLKDNYANNVQVRSGSSKGTINLTAELTEGANVGVTMGDVPTEDTVVQITSTESGTIYYNASATYFNSDAEGYYTKADSDLNAVVLSATVYVATVTSGETVTKYETLQEAINAATTAGDTATLLTDVTENVTVAKSQSITLDLAGYTITAAKSGSVITINGSLTLVDSSEDGTGMITGATGIGSTGGTVRLNTSGATFTMNGGSITGNTVYNGGGVYVGSGCTFTMDDGVISNNTAGNYGGGVYISSKGTFTMNGGSIENNTANGSYGGGVLLNVSTSTFIMTGGSITGNSAKSSGGGVALTNGTFKLSGKVVISGNTVNGEENNVFENKSGSALITLTGVLEEGSSVGVTTADTPAAGKVVQITTSESGTAYYENSAQYFTSDDGYCVAADSGVSAVVLSCVASVTSGDTVTYYGTLQEAIDAATTAGDVVTLLADVTEDVTVAKGQDITLDLAGHTVTGVGGKKTVNVEGTLILNDSSEAQTGVITNGRLYIGGTSGSCTMNGGTITGNSTTNLGATALGGGVYVYGTFVMNGGTITGNKAQNGGGVYVDKGTFTMNGGSIENNTATAYGGGVAVHSIKTSASSAHFVMNGGTISENTAQNGGGVSYRSAVTGNKSSITINDGTIEKNTATKLGGGVYQLAADYVLNLSGNPVITDNTSSNGKDNLYLLSGGVITLTGELTDGASVGVTTGDDPASTENGIVLITSSEDGTTYYVDSAQYFTSDNTAYDVVANSENSAVVLGVKYTIHFDANGGDDIDDMTVVSSGTYKFPTSALSGYSQAGWYILGSDNTLSESVYVKGGKSLTVYGTEDVTLFMVRAVLAPTVKVKLTTESDVISDGYTYYYPPNSTRFLTATVTEYDGFTYTYSWAKDGETIEGATDSVLTLAGNVSDTGTYTVTVTAIPVDDTVVTTNGAASTTTSGTKVTIRQATNALYYDANGGEGGPSNNFSNGVNLTVQSTEPVRDGYTFAGWNTEADGSGDSYQGGDIYSFEETNNNGNGGMRTTLYAQWKAIATVTMAELSQTYTGEAITAGGAVVTLANGEEYDGEIIYTYYTDEACTQVLDGAPVNAGTYYVIASIPETSAVNAAASDPVKLTILEGEFAVTATGYTGAYDGEGHSITVTADGAEITYSTNGETYSAENPIFTEAGEYTVYYTAHKDNYTDVSGSVTVVITKAAQAVSFAESEVNKTVGDDDFTNALTGAEGSVTYESSDTSVATVDGNGKVTIVGAGSAIITATVAGTDNYDSVTLSYTLTVAEAAAPEEPTETEEPAETTEPTVTPTATPATSTAAKTGDDANIALWLVLLVLCVGGMATVIVTRSCRKRN
ncbi:MAG: InlB B-repeat-containing protein [Oscillospiraceae bacterium]|nr:InlB B-repeat-containing protein [Oscillospiraceae bacterium]